MWMWICSCFARVRAFVGLVCHCCCLRTSLINFKRGVCCFFFSHEVPANCNPIVIHLCGDVSGRHRGWWCCFTPGRIAVPMCQAVAGCGGIGSLVLRGDTTTQNNPVRETKGHVPVRTPRTAGFTKTINVTRT